MNTSKTLQCLVSAIAVTTFSAVSVSVSENNVRSLELGASANAGQTRVQWSPEKSRGSAGGTLSGGRRGTEATCGASAQTAAITLLVPAKAEGLVTTSGQPMFSWFVDTQTPTTMKFVLQDSQLANPVFTQSVQAKRSGIMSVALPDGMALKPSTQYRWTVFVACANGQQEIFARSFIQRNDNPELNQRVSGKSAMDQAIAYAKAGVWYDAIAPLINAYRINPNDVIIKAELKSLLLQANNLSSEQRLKPVIDQL